MMPITAPFRELRAQSKEHVRAVIQRFSYMYLAIVVLFALAGYVYLLLFPALVLFGIGHLYDTFSNEQTMTWHELLAVNSMILFACLLSLRVFKTTTTPPKGLALNEDKAPVFFDLTRQLQKQYRGTHIDRVIITGEFELDIVKTSKWCLPLWSTNTLVIGLPLLKTLSPRLFQCALAGRVGQFSKRTNIVTNWLYQMRAIWQQYQQAYARGKGIDRILFVVFFNIYTPLYKFVSAYAAHLDILAADRYILEKNGDHHALETICTLAVTSNYLECRYWPTIHDMSRNGGAQITCAKMSRLWQKWLGSQEAIVWMYALSENACKWNAPTPALRNRIENIGHLEGRLPTIEKTTAATLYLGASESSVAKVIDMQWLAANKLRLSAQSKTAKPGWLNLLLCFWRKPDVITA